MFVTDERQKSALKPLVFQKNQPLMKMHGFPSLDGDKSSLRSSEGGRKPFLTKNSAVSRLAAKSSSVRSSCHDACKFGHHHAFPEPDAAKSVAKSTAKKSSKVSAAKVSRPAVVATVTAKITNPPVKSRDSGVSVKKLNSGGPKLSSVSRSVEKSNSKLNSVYKSGGNATSVAKSGAKFTSAHKSGGRLSSVNGNSQLSGERSVRSIRTNISTPESKFKVTRSLFRSPRAISSERLKILTSKISIDDVSSTINNFPQIPSKAARSLAFESPRFCHTLSSEHSFKILDDKAEEEFFRQFEAPPKSHDEISFEGLSDYSEISPRSLEAYLQEAHDYVGNKNTEKPIDLEAIKMRFRRRKEVVDRDSNPEPESVVLKHQDVQGRKGSEDYLINHAIEEAVSKLSNSQESKVKVLVGAFETVMNLKDSHNTQNDQMILIK